MKKVFACIALIIGCLLAVNYSQVSAHAGGPPYVIIDGVYVQTNPILNSTLPTMITVGSDAATQSGLLVGNAIAFSVDEKFFPNPYAQAQSPFGLPVVNQKEQINPVFRWDFKDGTEKTEGNPVTHTYTKPGTYIIEMDVKYPGKDDQFSQVNTVQVNIVPEQGYELPQAIVKIADTVVNDPLVDTVTVKPVTPTLFDASQSKGSVVSYAWDFGDDTGSDKKTLRHRYSRDIYFPTVVLRVTDKNNIVSDTYALVDLPFEKPNPVMGVVYSVMDFITGLFYRE